MNKTPDFVIIPLEALLPVFSSEQFPSQCIKDIIQVLVHSYPHQEYNDGLWVVMEKNIPLDQMTANQLQALEVRLELLSHSCDNYIQSYLGRYSDNYVFHKWVEPWTVVFKKNQ